MRFHLSKTMTMDAEHDRDPGYGWPECPPGNGLPDARSPWGEGHAGFQSHHQSPIHEHNGFVYNTMPEQPMYAASSMLPPRTTYQQLQPLITSPQLPTMWPSMLSSQSSNQSSPQYSVTGHVPSVPLSAPVSAGRAVGRSGTNPRKTLTDLDRRNMCLLAEENPTMKQTEIGHKFGVERSTVSKVLRQKEKYMQQDDGSRSPVRKPKLKGADVERCLANWAKKQHKRGEGPSDEALKKKYYGFANAAGSHDAHLKANNPAWIKKFRLQHNLLGSKSRKSSIADESEGTSNPPSGTHTPSISPCSPPLSGKEPSPSAMSIIKNEDRMKSESPPFESDFSFGHKPYHSLSNASLASAFNERGPFSPGPGSPGSSFFGQDPSSPFNQDRIPSSGPGSYQRPRSQTFPMVDPGSYMSPPSSEPLTPKYTSSTALDHSPLGDMSSALSSVEELHEPSPDMHHLPPPMISNSPHGLALGGISHGMPSQASMNQNGHQHSSPPTPGPGLHAPGSPSLADTRQALEIVRSFLQAQPNGAFEPQDYMTIGKLMQQLNLQPGQLGGEIGFHRVGSGDFNQYMKQE